MHFGTHETIEAANSVKLEIDSKGTRGTEDWQLIKTNIIENWQLIQEFLRTKSDEEIEAITKEMKVNHTEGGGDLVGLLLNKEASAEAIVEECNFINNEVLLKNIFSKFWKDDRYVLPIVNTLEKP